MSVLVLGVSHHSADLALLERLAVPAGEHRKALTDLLGLEHVLEPEQVGQRLAVLARGHGQPFEQR